MRTATLRPAPTVLGALFALLALGFACSGGERGDFGQGGPDASTPPLPFADASDDACVAEGVVCSRDLHSVLDACTRAVKEVCPPEMGCAEGRCVSACASAESNKGTVGCSFWTVPASGEAYPEAAGGCFASSITNTWNAPVRITAEYDGAPLDISKSTFIPRLKDHQVEYEPLDGPLPPKEVAVVFLSQAPVLPPRAIPCPRPVALAQNPLPEGTGRAHAFRLSTDFPVSAYSVFPYGGASSAISAATVLLPISSWGTNYLMVDGWDSRDVDVASSRAAIQIVASEDDTHVRIGAQVAGAGSPDASASESTEVTLGKGELLQILQRRDFAGKPVESDKPIALFGGADCLDVPARIKYCDSAQQQIPPLPTWGHEYAAVRFRNRTDLYYGEGSAVDEESVPWRIVGAVDGTQLTYEPERPPDAPVRLALGESKIFWSRKPFVVKSQGADHPFYLAGYMTGADSDGACFIGDPDFVNVVPTHQYLDSYVFFADVTYQFTTVTVVRRDEGHGFRDVTLDCAGKLRGWKNLDGTDGEASPNGRIQYTYVDLLRHWDPQPYPGGGVCGSGRHEIQSEGPFAVTIWGLAPYDSYAYPGGAGVRSLTDIHVPVR